MKTIISTYQNLPDFKTDESIVCCSINSEYFSSIAKSGDQLLLFDLLQIDLPKEYISSKSAYGVIDHGYVDNQYGMALHYKPLENKVLILLGSPEEMIYIKE